ncbi:glycosyltransferase [Pedobacter sp. LMG 31464]|uniref:Glycosyltransferase n=1 Tax=Pedobacter planticolens TaxID=2679964 RepID=A0A923DXR0_9SPHI|nr:glycosyltransferase [Pedobacter planticolens]MBB2145982.1 glycosyltransferase [Pedobacter planticolens]
MQGKQIFQTATKGRWIAFKWIFRSLIIIFTVAAICVGYTLLSVQYPVLPSITSTAPLTNKQIKVLKRSQPYRDFKVFKANLVKINHDKELHHLAHPDNKKRINAAFYVNWVNGEYFNNLKEHIGQLDMVITESFFLNEDGIGLTDKVDEDAIKLVKAHHKTAIAVVSNYSAKQKGWNSKAVHYLLQNKQAQNEFITLLISNLKHYGFDGVNIDFEELKETTDEPLIAFEQNLYTQLHAQNLLVTQDISPDNNDYDPNVLQKYNDYIFVMAYDQHSELSNPGEISNQEWVEEQLDHICAKMPANKVILALACYGYDWPQGSVGTPTTYSNALSVASTYNSKITYNTTSANLNYSYTDENLINHRVFFTDAITNYNLIRKADDWDIAGIALWRLGSEDPRLWTFISKDLSLEALKKTGIETKKLRYIGLNNKIDYIGSGEILDLISTPKPGLANITLDSLDYTIQNQEITELPKKYVIRRYGEADKKIVLSFDDGPDPTYTPKILSILKKEKVPASFFVVGIMAEQNMNLLRQEYTDGYEIGNHTFFHPDMAKIGAKRVKFELNATRRLIECVTGHSTILFRAPFNADAEPQTIEEVLPVAQSRAENYINIGEDIDPQDWQPGRTPDQIFNSVIAQKDQGNIILLHDAGGNREATIAALPRIIKYFKDNGYKFTTIGNLISKTKNELMPALKSDADSGFTGSGDYIFLSILSYGSLILYFVFSIAIILALIRCISIVVLAIKQKKKTAKEAHLLIQYPTEMVSVIIPAYNEEVTIIQTLNSLLKTTYTHLEFIFVDDGSTDKTFELVKANFSNNPKIKIFSKVNGGKASALNYGIAQATGKYLVCIDADTQLKHNAITELIRHFYTDDIGAVAGTVKVGNANNIITKWQSIEYITAQNMDRRAFGLLNTITVVPGAIGAFRKSVVLEIGGFTTDTLAEDCDLTMRILKAGYVVKNAENAIAYTEAPETVSTLFKQRFRWSFGVMQSFWKNRKTLFNKKYGYFGMVGMPNILIFQIILPVFSPLADLFMIFSLIGGLCSLGSVGELNLEGIKSIVSLSNGFGQVLLYYCIFIIVDLFFAAIAFKMEKEKLKNLLYIIPQRFFWRQLMYLVLFKSIRKAIKGELENWGTLKRTGNVKEQLEVS